MNVTTLFAQERCPQKQYYQLDAELSSIKKSDPSSVQREGLVKFYKQLVETSCDDGTLAEEVSDYNVHYWATCKDDCKKMSDQISKEEKVKKLLLKHVDASAGYNEIKTITEQLDKVCKRNFCLKITEAAKEALRDVSSMNQVVNPKLNESINSDPIGRSPISQGDILWGVYLAIDKPGSTTLRVAEKNIKDVKFPTGTGELSCDHGAAQALHITDDKDLQYVAVYFSNESDAKQFASTQKEPVRGIAKVTIFCAD